ncbi:MAG: hypothetical protein J6N76_09370 [Lachnospiraceae bacterium]|nr:hypothetical protein [Lachnospiraceae bacterium]
MALSVIKTIYIMAVLPLLCGGALRRIQRVKSGVIECYGIGFIALMGIYAVGSFIPLRRGIGLSELSACCLYAALIMGVISLVILLIPREYGIASVFSETVSYIRSITSSKQSLTVMAAAVILLFISLFFTVSSAADTVPETVRTMIATGRFYENDIYSRQPLEHPVIPRFAWESMFAVMASLSGIDSFVFVHKILAASLIIAGYGIYIGLSKRFIPTDERERLVFFGTVIGLYGIELFHDGALQFGFFYNIWFGQTLAVTLIFPAVFEEVLLILHLIRGRLAKDRGGFWKS